eukprot:TRINITY_DN14621_c0_g1_i1.p1 TRINITY_DN14621_c0_g1~~TRINITY_DN14621_c0_g1_i1.p1  ORF type:complete len:400 (-),score=58.63 TRINITY_DN14621_c0_g1_i1:79-1221(-)
MERKIRFLDKQVQTDPEAIAVIIDAPVNISMDALEAKLAEEETELLEANTNQETLIYNDCFSIPLDLFGSKWELVHASGSSSAEDAEFIQTGVYAFGIDPVWLGKSRNALQFYNSIKMKMSIIYGVTQMLLGISMHLLNSIHFKRPYNLFFEFIPQFLFLSCLFGYMCFMIFWKWATYFPNPSESPNILITMINIFLKPFELEWPELFPGQLHVQQALAIIAIVCIPFMLFPKPFLLRRDHKHGYVQVGGHGGHGGHFDFAEIFVHQIIHTIEFVLGAISNTASYLRLWALSLAHAELSEVFWEKAMLGTMGSGFYLIFVGWAVWAGFTVAVLLVMEALSAFLHALRLHWVEFQNKFFDGDGKPFTPFSYADLQTNLNPQ